VTNQWNPDSVFQFIPPQGISKTQLDVTVTSDSDVPAYLKVSQDCKDVKENIRLVDYKGESIRLSFAKKGGITLSKVSLPPLTDSTSSWFIGIALKNDTGATKPDARKTGTLTLTKSFDYSYAKPITILVLLTFLSGVIVSLFAFACFKELFCARYCKCDCSCDCTSCQLCCKGFGEHFCRCLKVVYHRWFTRGPKTYSYITGIVGFVLMVGAFQFVLANWHVMIHEGDRDNCYYNDFCYRVSHWHDIPFNLMMSNLVYILHGLTLAVCVCCMEARHVTNDEELKLKENISFSIGYAFAWALIFEGCFSLIYHLCPSKMTFQFDTAFMFVIAGFIVVISYNGIKENKFAPESAKGPVGAANFFLYFLVPLLIFNYFGSLHHFQLHHSAEGMSKPLKITFFVFVGIWWVIIVFWAALKLCVKESSIIAKSLYLFVGFVGPVLGFIFGIRNLPQAFLYSFIAESFLAILFKAYYRCDSKSCPSCLSCLRVFYVLGLLVVGGIALYLFIKNRQLIRLNSRK